MLDFGEVQQDRGEASRTSRAMPGGFDRPKGSAGDQAGQIASRGENAAGSGVSQTRPTDPASLDDISMTNPLALQPTSAPSFKFTFANTPHPTNNVSPPASNTRSQQLPPLAGPHSSARPIATPPGRRSGAPTSIPNFPSATEPRDSLAQFSPSPSASPGATSPFKSPPTPNTPPAGLTSRASGLSLSGQPFALPHSSASGVSPWHALAASSGAPTPSLEGPGRSSPHLGGPFEMLNLEGSWSGANIWGGGQSAGSSRNASIDTGLSNIGGGSYDLPESGSGMISPSKPSTSSSQPLPAGGGMTGGISGAGPMSADMMARYRSMAGRASASGRRSSTDPAQATISLPQKSQSGPTPMEGVEFSQSPPSSTQSTAGAPSSKPPLPAALARRRASLPKVGLGNALNPGMAHLTKSPSPLASNVASAESTPPAPALRPLSPNSLPGLLSKPATLLLDVRPPSAFLTAHINSAHSLPVPSTLLRRPAFNLAKLTTMLSPSSQEAVKTWKSKSDIIIIDTESTSATDGGILDGLAGKFEREGFGGKVWFVRGGQNALGGVQDLDVVRQGKDELDATGGMDVGPGSGPSQMSPSGHLVAGGLGAFAFHSGSTGSGRAIDGGAPATTPGLALRADPFSTATTERPFSLSGMTLGRSAMSTRASSKNSSQISLSQLGVRAKMQPANPFFDNIRQNLELSHGGIIERISLQLPPEAKRRAHEMPAWLSELVTLPEQEAADRLAGQFYTLERNEQKRLQAVMDWHSRGSGAVLGHSKIEREDRAADQFKGQARREKGSTASQGGRSNASNESTQENAEAAARTWEMQKRRDKDDVDRLEAWRSGVSRQTPEVSGGQEYYPFSITAGVERGTKNRYKNIWPYDFSRVRLESRCDDQSDYINASYIQPRGTARRYIATQGPLDATYRDFWTLVWEQDVRVIVMLTKQYEGGLLKCGNYWQGQTYGNLHLNLDRHVGGDDAPPQSAQTTGFDFGMSTPASTETAPGERSNIRREFTLSHDDYAEPRKIVQIQSVNWPDFDVPDSPDVLLALIRDVDQALDDICPDASKRREGRSPVLVHCSAGVGRTGSYIVVDCILEALTRERKAAYRSSEDTVSSLTDIAENAAGQMASRPPTATSSSLPLPSGDETRNPNVSGENAMTEPRAIRAGSTGTDQSLSGGKVPPLRVGSHTSNKSVSFADHPFGIGEGVKPLSTSPAMISRAAVPEPPTLGVLATNPQESPMDIDVPDASSQTQTRPGLTEDSINHMDKQPWTQYRGKDDESSIGGGMSEAGAGAGAGGRRPSLFSVHSLSEERIHGDQLTPVDEEPRPILTAEDRRRSPSPLSGMDNPVLDVLESMRVQRMSLVQTLRQFVFVHRVIIHQYLAMIDEEAGRERDANRRTSLESVLSGPGPIESAGSTSSIPLASSSTTTTDTLASTTSVSTAPTSIVTDLESSGGDFEAEAPPKRRASPTELSHDRPSLEEPRPTELLGSSPRKSGASLGKRVSVKRMRQDPSLSGSKSPAPSTGSASSVSAALVAGSKGPNQGTQA